MKDLLKKLWSDEDGITLIMVALLVVVFMGMSALVVDAGMLYQERRTLVKAADAAALAGAQELARNGSATTTSVAQNYASANAKEMGDVTVNVNEADKRVTVTVNKSVNNHFARILGHNTTDVSARATATFEYPKKITNIKRGNVLPLFLDENQYRAGLDGDGDINESFIYKLMGGNNHHVVVNGVDVPGNWGALYLGPSAFDDALAGRLHSDIQLEINHWFEGTKPGSMGANVYKPIDYRLDPDNSLPPYGLIPIISEVEEKGSGKLSVYIIGFAVFEITGYEKNPPGYNIIGHLRGDIPVSDFFGETTSSEEDDFGALVIKLVE